MVNAQSQRLSISGVHVYVCLRRKFCLWLSVNSASDADASLLL